MIEFSINQFPFGDTNCPRVHLLSRLVAMLFGKTLCVLQKAIFVFWNWSQQLVLVSSLCAVTRVNRKYGPLDNRVQDGRFLSAQLRLYLYKCGNTVHVQVNT